MLDFSKIRVLVTEAAGKQSLTIVRGLKDIGCHVTVICGNKSASCYVSNRPDVKIINEHIFNRDEQALGELIRLVRIGSYDVIMPIGELGTSFITEHEEELKPYVKLACAPRVSYINAFDKQRTFDIAAENGIPAPKTRLSNQSVEDYLKSVEFPLIIKPRNGLGSVGFHKFEKPEDFAPYIKKNNIDLDAYVLQEYVDYDKRLGTILFVDQKGNVCMSYADEVLRWFPIDAGSACLIKSIDNPEVIEWSSRLLKAMNWQGVAALSFMVDKKTGVPKLLEINGRIPASIKLSRQCGFNVAKLLIEMAYDSKVEQYPPNTKFGVYTRHIDLDLAWFFKSKNRFKADPSWFSWKNTEEVMFYKDDKKPFITHFFHQLKQYRKIMKRKKH